MGKNTPDSRDEVSHALEHTFTAVGVSEAHPFEGEFNVTMYGGVGFVQVEVTFDGGANWVPTTDILGTPIVPAIPCAYGGAQTERKVFYRFNCTAYTSGAIYCRISQ